MCALKLKTFQQLKVNKSHTLLKRAYLVGMYVNRSMYSWMVPPIQYPFQKVSNYCHELSACR